MASPDEAEIPRWTRAGTAFLGGAGSALVATVPAALRVVEAGGFFDRWTALAACTMLPATAMVFILRGARRGLASFSGPAVVARVAALLSWALSLLVFFTAFGTLLRQKTHHHALAGVTFAITALVASVVLALVWHRIAAFFAGRGSTTQRVALAAAAGSLLVFFLALGTSLARGAAEGKASPLGACVVDLLAVTIASGLFSRPEITRSRWLAAAGPPLAIGVLALGLIVVRRAEVNVESFAGAPAHLWMLAAMSR